MNCFEKYIGNEEMTDKQVVVNKEAGRRCYTDREETDTEAHRSLMNTDRQAHTHILVHAQRKIAYGFLKDNVKANELKK